MSLAGERVAISAVAQHTTCLLQVGDSFTIADSQVATTLTSAFVHLIGKQQQKQLPSVMRWFQTCVNQPLLAPHIGEPAQNLAVKLLLADNKGSVHFEYQIIQALQ